MSVNPEIPEDAIFLEAYITCLIDCSKCGNALKFRDALDPMEAWAKEASHTARKLGWTANHNSEILCPNCVSK